MAIRKKAPNSIPWTRVMRARRVISINNLQKRSQAAAWPHPSVVMLHSKHFPEEFLHTPARRTERLAAQWSDGVNAPPRLSITLEVRAQIAFALQSVQNGIESSRTQFVPMTRQLLGDPNSIKRLFRGVMEDVQTDQPRVKACVIHIDCRCPVSISKLNI